MKKIHKRMLFLSFTNGLFGYLYGRYSSEHQQPEQPKQKEQSLLKFETPIINIEYPHFKIIYSTYHKCPIVVHEVIDEEIARGDAPRAKYFFAEQEIRDKEFQVDNSYFYDTGAYRKFNLNRGHMAAAGNYSGSECQKFHTFSFSNIIPQNAQNNGGIWNTFERYARDLAVNKTCEKVEIISGPIFAKEDEEKGTTKCRSLVLKENGITIPEKLYKVVRCIRKEDSYASAFEFFNKETEDNQKQIGSFQTSFGELEEKTGIKFHFKDKSLKEIESQPFKRLKKDYDFEFFMKLMANSRSLKEMNGILQRAKSQKIFIDFDELSTKIDTFTIQEFKKTQEDQTLSSCQKLQQVLKTNKNLFFLFQASKYSQKIITQEESVLPECTKSETQDDKTTKQRILKNLKEKGYRYLNTEHLIESLSKAQSVV